MRGGLVAGAKMSTALIPLFAKKFFHAVRTRGGTNEVDRTNILAPGLPYSIEHDPSSRLHRSAFARRLALGKLYPVTAAQLLPIHTGFLAPIHESSSQRTAFRNSDLRLPVQGFSSATFVALCTSGSDKVKKRRRGLTAIHRISIWVRRD